MSRKFAALVEFGLVAMAVFAPRSAAQNVILISIDTLRADHLHCYGYRLETSPNLDRLAHEGVRFADAYTTIPLTLPAHTAIMTGELPARSGVEDYTSRLSPRGPATLAELLRAHGFATAAVVAAPVLDHRFGLSRGFDVYEDQIAPITLEGLNWVPKRLAGDGVNRALAWIKTHWERKFFFWLHLYDPHRPRWAPAPIAAEFQSPYDAEIAYADHEVGRLLDGLRTMGLYAKTIIAVVADHGESLGEHGESTHGFFVYRATLRVPLILRLPAGQDVEARGQVIHTNVANFDLFPTILELEHVALPPNIDAASLLPLLGAHFPASGGGWGRAVYAESELPYLHYGWSDLRTIIASHYQYILAPRPELYDLAQDPREVHNLAGSDLALADTLRGRLLSLQAHALAGPRGATGHRPMAHCASFRPSRCRCADGRGRGPVAAQ
ncbi:MAG: sulfatase [Terriglobales bacterium]